MKHKKILLILIILLGFFVAFCYYNEVRAETIEYSELISAEKLENIKKNKIQVLATPQLMSSLNPENEDTCKFYYNQLKHEVSRNTYYVLEHELSNKVNVNLNNYEFKIESYTKEALVECFRQNLLSYVIDGYEAYVMDSAQNYWWTSDFEVGNIEALVSNGIATFKTVELISKMKEWSNFNAFNIRLKEVGQSINGDTTYEIVRSINYYICKNVEYKIIDNSEIEQTAYGALMQKSAVCEGQAHLFNQLCREKGIKCINVYGYTNQNNTTIAHAWNYVYEPTKKEWFAVDVTWNNQFNDNLYLMVGSSTIINNQTFDKNHIAGFKQYKAQTYTPISPELSKERYIDAICLENNYIKNIQPNTKYEELIKEFSYEMEITVMQDNIKIAEEDLIKTGQVLMFEDNQYILVVKGDTNGDGKADLKDMLNLNKHRLNKGKILDEFAIAGDVDRDNRLDLKDILFINLYRLKKINEM